MPLPKSTVKHTWGGKWEEFILTVPHPINVGPTWSKCRAYDLFLQLWFPLTYWSLVFRKWVYDSAFNPKHSSFFPTSSPFVSYVQGIHASHGRGTHVSYGGVMWAMGGGSMRAMGGGIYGSHGRGCQSIWAMGGGFMQAMGEVVLKALLLVFLPILNQLFSVTF